MVCRHYALSMSHTLHSLDQIYIDIECPYFNDLIKYVGAAHLFQLIGFPDLLAD
jgi:hypothetical protein